VKEHATATAKPNRVMWALCENEQNATANAAASGNSNKFKEKEERGSSLLLFGTRQIGTAG
jgi:hypothetical protein